MMVKQVKIHAARNADIRKDSFAYGLNFYKIIWVFVAGCLIGYGAEMLWCYVRSGYFESRQGLIYGPLNPVYGLGAVLFTVLLYRFHQANSALIFAASSIIGGAFEYFCSFAQEIMFGTVSWEYSASPLNLNGRTNLAYSLSWGLLGLIFIKHTLPFLTKWIERIPNRLGKVLTWIFFIALILNITISAAAVRRQTDRHNGVPAANSISTFLDTYYSDEYLQKIYPNMQVVKP